MPLKGHSCGSGEAGLGQLGRLGGLTAPLTAGRTAPPLAFGKLPVGALEVQECWTLHLVLFR